MGLASDSKVEKEVFVVLNSGLTPDSVLFYSQMDLNCKNRGSYTPLMYAAYIGHDNIVNLLLDACVDVNLANDKGHTPLMLAASCGNESVCYFLREVRASYLTFKPCCLCIGHAAHK